MAVYLGENKVGITMGSSSGGSVPSHTHGNITNDGKLTESVNIANGDKLLITDSSDSNIIKRTGIAFDGATATMVLAKSGSWVSVPNTDFGIYSNAYEISEWQDDGTFLTVQFTENIDLSHMPICFADVNGYMFNCVVCGEFLVLQTGMADYIELSEGFPIYAICLDGNPAL